MMSASRRKALTLALLLAVVAGSGPALAEEASGAKKGGTAIGKVFRKIGHATRDATRTIGHATRDTTRKIGHGTRDATREVGHASRDAAHGVRDGIKGSD